MTRLGTFATETTGESEILGLDGDTLGVDGAQAGCRRKGHVLDMRFVR